MQKQAGVVRGQRYCTNVGAVTRSLECACKYRLDRVGLFSFGTRWSWYAVDLKCVCGESAEDAEAELVGSVDPERGVTSEKL